MPESLDQWPVRSRQIASLKVEEFLNSPDVVSVPTHDGVGNEGMGMRMAAIKHDGGGEKRRRQVGNAGQAKPALPPS